MESNTSEGSFSQRTAVGCENNGDEENACISTESHTAGAEFSENTLENSISVRNTNLTAFPGFQSDLSIEREEKQQVESDGEYWRDQQIGFPSSFLVDTQYLQLCRHVVAESNNMQGLLDSWESSERTNNLVGKKKSSPFLKFADFPVLPDSSFRDCSTLPPSSLPFSSQEYVDYDLSKSDSLFLSNDGHPFWDYSLSSSTKSVPFTTASSHSSSMKDNETFPVFGTEDKHSTTMTVVDEKSKQRSCNDKTSMEPRLTPVGPRILVEDILLSEHRKSDHNGSNFSQSENRRVDEDSYYNHGERSCSTHHPSSGSKTLKKRLIWTPELHDRFLKAVNAVGVNNAVPKTILYLMNVEGLTSEHVKSHLQKYRNNLKKAAKRQRESESFHSLNGQPLYGSRESATSEDRNLYDNSWRPNQAPESSLSRDETGNNAMIDNIMELDLQIQSIVHLLVTARHRVAELSMSLEQWVPHYSSNNDWIRVLKEQTSLFQQNEMQLLQIQRDFEKQQRELKNLERWNLPGAEQENS